ncbi:thermonuclease family protein [Leisingera sp. XS_AS12]|uniref:thermonuclease family protein n=1 Tax=Leisingera sp. XS_AS12 TaxID=3241294 RepID=UPI00351756BC
MAMLASQIRVVDGDTIEYAGRKYRLTGYDTPETHFSECSSEKALGDRATRRLRQLIDRADSVRLETERGTDRYGRGLGRLLIDGRDAGDLLINEGLARPYRGGQRQSWC